MKKIGLISDTHNHLPEKALELFEGCDHIIHAGDICRPDILWTLETVAPVTAVLGNNDYLDFGVSVNAVADRSIDGVRFVITHKPTDMRKALESAFIKDRESEPIVAVYGHKHVPYLNVGGKDHAYNLMISPGSVFRSREEAGRRTIGFVIVDEGRIDDAYITDLSGNTIMRL